MRCSHCITSYTLLHTIRAVFRRDCEQHGRVADAPEIKHEKRLFLATACRVCLSRSQSLPVRLVIFLLCTPPPALRRRQRRGPICGALVTIKAIEQSQVRVVLDCRLRGPARGGVLVRSDGPRTTVVLDKGPTQSITYQLSFLSPVTRTLGPASSLRRRSATGTGAVSNDRGGWTSTFHAESHL